MPPLSAWFEGRDAVAGFVEQAIFASARPYGVSLRPGWCNGQPAFAIYEPDDSGRLVASGLQVLELDDVRGQFLITGIVSFRDPGLPVRCGLPAAIS
jgi:RNA polymerase sigma-70 factor (ECF subfamily)